MKINRIKLMLSLCFVLSPVTGWGQNLAESLGGESIKKEPEKIWRAESQALYDLLVAQLKNSEADYEGSVDTLIKYAKKQKDEKLLSKSFISLLQTERYSDALMLLDFWKDVSESDLSKFQVLALVLNGNVEQAIAIVEKSLGKVADQAGKNFLLDDYVKLLLSYWYQSDTVLFVEKLHELYPNNKKLPWLLARQLRWQGKLEKADDILSKLLFEKPKSLALLQEHSDLFRYAGFVEKAEKIWKDALKDYPRETRIRLGYARFLFECYQFKQALQQLNKVDGSSGSDFASEISYLKMALLVRLGEYDKAESAFAWDELTQEERDVAHFDLGSELLKKQQLVPSFQQFEKVSEEGRLALSVALKKVQIDYQKSVAKGDESFDKIVKEYQIDKAAAIREQASLLSEAGRKKLAYQRLSEYLQHAPNNDEVRYSRALLATEIDLMGQAVKDLSLMSAKSPENKDFQNALGYTLLETSEDKEELKEAMSLIKKSLFRQPRSPAVVDSMGWALYKQGKVKESLPFLLYAYGKYQEPEVIGHLIAALFMAGHKKQAQALYQLEMKFLKNRDKINKYTESFKKELSK